jgi:hypothetical protein
MSWSFFHDPLNGAGWMRNTLKVFVLAVGGLMAAGAWAVPTLQLNITGGTYDATTQTVILDTGATSFVVNAYLDADNKNAAGDDYALSVALAPKTGPADVNLGSFQINGSTVNVTADMVYGVPPLEAVHLQSHDPGDLSTHSIFHTFFYETAFDFSGASTTAVVNTEDTPGYDPTAAANSGSDLHYRQFSIDLSSLDQVTLGPIGLHFDLYNRSVCSDTKGQCQVVGDVDQSKFAPYSHDAEWVPPAGGRNPPGGELPIPAPLALISLGGLLLGWLRRSEKR